jgi:hypothetical protein
MAREPFQSSSPQSQAVAASEITVADREGGTGRIALLLTVAAVVAAVIGARAAMISSQAGDEWQSSLRTTEKRAASVMNDVRSMYQGELPMAVRILQAQLLAQQLASAAPGQSPDVERALNVEAGVQAQMSDGLPKTALTEGAYALPSGGFDLGERMADLRASSGLSNLDPEGLLAGGDQLAHKAVLLTYALLPTSLGALLGVLAQPLRRYRTYLLGSGTAFVAAGGVVALAVEVLA